MEHATNAAESAAQAAAAVFQHEQLEELKADLLKALYHEDAYDWSWVLCFLIFVGIIVSVIVLKKLFLDWVNKQTKKTDNKVDDFLVDIVEKWSQLYVVAPFAFFVATQTYPIANAVDTFAKAAFLGMLTWRVIRSTEMTINFAMDHYVFQHDQEGENLKENFHKGLRLVLYTAGGVFILDNCGLNISSLVAGFGIGGLAIALAAQAILGDTIASLTMFMDKPFLIGDCISVSGHTGIVEHIGFKTTRIRAMTGEVIIFPNSAISGSTIQNFRKAKEINRALDIGIDVNTEDQVVRDLPQILMDALSDKEGFRPAEVYFKEFGTSSLTYEVRFTVLSNSPSDIRAATGNINTIINETCKAKGISMPYPTEIVINKNGGSV